MVKMIPHFKFFVSPIITTHILFFISVDKTVKQLLNMADKFS